MIILTQEKGRCLCDHLTFNGNIYR